MALCDPDESVFTVAELLSARRAFGLGRHKEVDFGDKKVVYNSLEDLRIAIIYMESMIYPCSVNTGKRTYAITSKGLC